MIARYALLNRGAALIAQGDTVAPAHKTLYVLQCIKRSHVTACGFAESPMATLWHRSASVQFVTSLNRSDCYRLERQLPGGFRTR